MSDDKVIRFPTVQGGKDSGEAEVMVLLGQASNANLVKIAIIGVDEDGNVFRETNGTEIEAVALHESAKLQYFFEG
jgi:hypothetical protein